MSDQFLFDSSREDEIDLREWVRTVFHYWWLVVGLGLLAALAALGAAQLQTPTYEAASVIAVSRSRYYADLDQRIKAPEQGASAKALAAIATTDEVLSQVVASQSLPPALQSVAGLRAAVGAIASSDPEQVTLRARAADPAVAAAVANAWAEVLVARSPDAFSQERGELAYYRARLDETQARLARVEADFAGAQSSGNLAVVRAQLDALQREYEAHLADRTTIARLLGDVAVFDEHLAKLPAGAPVSAADDLVLTMLQARVFSVGMSSVMASNAGRTEAAVAEAAPTNRSTGAAAAPTVQVQVGASEASASRTAGEARKLLAGLGASLEARSRAVEAKLAEAAPRLLEQQRRAQAVQAQLDRLALDREATREAYRALARKIESVQLVSQGTEGQVRVASSAATPSKSTGPSAARNVAVAAVLGALVGVAGALGLGWWRQGGQRSTTASSPSVPELSSAPSP